MRWRYIWVFLLIAIVCGGVYYFYFYKEKPAQQVVNLYSNLTIESTFNGNKVETEYQVYFNGGFYREGKTSLYGSTLEFIPLNSTFFVLSKNLENQTFYSYKSEEKFSTQNQIYRVNLELKSPGEINVSHVGKFGTDKNITFKISSKGFTKDLIMCSKWSLDTVYVRSNFTTIEKPENYKTYDRCFELGISLNNNETSIPVSYELWGNQKNETYIQFAFIDRDEINNKKTSVILGNDIGMEDFVYILNINNI